MIEKCLFLVNQLAAFEVLKVSDKSFEFELATYKRIIGY